METGVEMSLWIFGILFLSGNQSTSFYVGVTDMMSEPTILVRYLLSNLTGSTVNVTQENCKNQRENKDDHESKHVRFITDSPSKKRQTTRFVTPRLSFQIFDYIWVQGAAPPNSTERQGFCVRSTVRVSKALSPAFEINDFTAKNYSTWTESRWKKIRGRIFLVASHDLEVNMFTYCVVPTDYYSLTPIQVVFRPLNLLKLKSWLSRSNIHNTASYQSKLTEAYRVCGTRVKSLHVHLCIVLQ